MTVWPMSARWRSVIDTVELLPSMVRSERERRGLSHRDAAVEMDYPYADLCRFEHGSKQPTLPSVLKMLRWLAASERLSSVRRQSNLSATEGKSDG